MKRWQLRQTASLLWQGVHELVMLMTDKFYRTKYRAVSHQLGLAERPESAERGFVVVQIDSLAYDHLLRALEKGYAPYLKRLCNQDHRLERYTCGLPSSTPACQSAIMYGNSYNVPAFRWYDKANRKTVSCKLPGNTYQLEQDVSRGRRGILEGGSSYSNLVSGGASRSLFTMSTFGQGSLLDGIKGLGFFALFTLSPVRTLRVALLSGSEGMYALCERTASYWKDQHRVRREGFFPLVRIFAHVFIKEMQTFMIMVDMYRGVPNIYTTYNLYDNMAHHFGPTSRPALRAIRTVDRQIRQIDRMRRHSALPYDLFVLSDHGQTPAVPFRQLYGRTFGQYVARMIDDLTVAEHVEAEDLARSHIAFLADEIRSAQRSLPPVTARAVDRIRRYVEQAEVQQDTEPFSSPHADVVAVGCSGMAGLYFNMSTGRVDLTRIQDTFPSLVDRLVEHPAVGLLIGHEGDHVVILGKSGRLIWDGRARVVGANPLADLDRSPWVLREVLRIADYPKSADLILLGSVTDGIGVAFEEQMGVHGAFGGQQAYPFIMAPPGVRWNLQELHSSHDLYERLIAYLPGAGTGDMDRPTPDLISAQS